MKAFPNGARIFNLQGQPGAGPAIDRNKGLHNVLDQHKDKYQVVAEQTAQQMTAGMGEFAHLRNCLVPLPPARR